MRQRSRTFSRRWCDVMILHTPRRRISPRTRRRYRAIRQFFQRALGSSQPDIKINSSIAINVTDLKRKIVGLEHQLHEVNKQCHDYTLPDHGPTNYSDMSIHLSDLRAIDTINEQTEPESKTKIKENDVETKLKHKSDFDTRDKVLSNVHTTTSREAINTYMERKPKARKSKLHKNREVNSKLYNHKAKSVHENLRSACSTSSFRSLSSQIPEAINKEFNDHYNKPSYSKAGYIESSARKKEKKHRSLSKSQKVNNDEYENIPKKYKQLKEFDSDFITDIIRRQYKPLKIIRNDRKSSEISQFSAPVCRDREFALYDDTREDPDFCSCCCNGRMRPRQLANMKSVCDTRLYSNKRHLPVKQRRINESHQNPDLYDLVPVKEKSSPKSRRKFTEDNNIPRYHHHLEVPPSPKSNRPRLNLKAHYHTECDDFISYQKDGQRPVSPIQKPNNYDGYISEVIESDTTSIYMHLKNDCQPKMTCKRVIQQSKHNEQARTSLGMSPHGHTIINDQLNAPIETNKDTKLRTDDYNFNGIKTDKALSEIKDILQSFLQEIKKEATGQSEKSDDIGQKAMPDNNANPNTNNIPNCSLCQFPSFIHPPPFLNACNYLPVCSLNYPMQTNLMKPHPSHVCMNCVSGTEPQCKKCHKNEDTSEPHNPVTEELIKEIRKLFAQGVVKNNFAEPKEHPGKHDKNDINKYPTVRSIGRQSLRPKQDAKVGTHLLLSHSKSCDTIQPKSLDTRTSNGNLNPYYSDTVLDKLSLNVSRSTIDSQLGTVTQRKEKQSRFLKVLNSFGIFKKKKRDGIEEMSNSGSTTEIDSTPIHIYDEVPYKQNITNYMMHDQEFYRPLPVGGHRRHYEPRTYHPEFLPPYNSEVPGYIHSAKPQYYCPNENPCNSQLPPQSHGPLCLKEIEVRSTSTQIEKKKSIFDKIKQKIFPSARIGENNEFNNFSTQTMQTPTPPLTSRPLFSWLLGKQGEYKPDHFMRFGLKTQHKLQEKDNKIRKGLMKKLFIKKQPFAPRNLVLSAMMHKKMYSAADNVMSPPRLFY